MKRYFTIARQVAKETIGTKDDSVNSEEVELEREHFVTLKEGYTKLQNTAKALYNEHLPSYLNHNETFISQLLTFSESLEGANVSTSTSTLADSLGFVGNGLRRENKIDEYCVQSDKSGFLEATHKICEIYIKDVNELRVKQEIARLRLSHTSGQLKNMQKKVVSSKDAASAAAKLQQAEDENRLAKEEYDNATSLFIEGMNRLESAGGNELISALTSLAEAHLRSMEDGVAMWRDVLASLERLETRGESVPNSPPTTPTPLMKPAQSSTPVLPHKPSPSAPRLTLQTSSSLSNSPKTPPAIALDKSASFPPFDASSDSFPTGEDPNSSPNHFPSESYPVTPSLGGEELSEEGVGSGEQDEYEELAL